MPSCPCREMRAVAACFGSVSGASRYDRSWPRLRARHTSAALWQIRLQGVRSPRSGKLHEAVVSRTDFEARGVPVSPFDDDRHARYVSASAQRAWEGRSGLEDK